MAFDGIGASVRRREDVRFLSGRGNYVDDMNRPGQLHAVIKRADRSHAAISSIETAAAAKAPGVIAVYTGADMAAALPGGGYAAVRGTSFAAPLVAARLAAQRGAPLAGLASEAKPGRAVGRGIVCDTCRSDPRNLRIKN